MEALDWVGGAVVGGKREGIIKDISVTSLSIPEVSPCTPPFYCNWLPRVGSRQSVTLSRFQRVEHGNGSYRSPRLSCWNIGYSDTNRKRCG